MAQLLARAQPLADPRSYAALARSRDWQAGHFVSGVLGSRAPEAITLGRCLDLYDGVTDLIRYDGDQSVLITGANGKGKGTRLLVPNLLSMRGGRSLVVVDPKGELAAITAPFRRTLGPVVILNPFGVHTNIPGYQDLVSDGFNPLLRLDPAAESFNSDVAQMAEALIVIDGKEPHFPLSARSLCAVMLMATVLEAKATGTVPTMARFREMLCEPSSEPNPGNSFLGSGIPKRALELTKSPLAGLRNKAAQFTDWNKEIQSIVSTARIQTESFDDPQIARDMAKGTFDFGSLKETPTTVYLILPPDMMERHAKWLRLVLTNAIQSVMRPRMPGKPRVTFILDEFYALGHLEIISTVWALIRGFGVSMIPVLQDVVQLKKLYPDNWETFVGMAGAVASFSPNDMTTAAWMSQRSGETTRDIETYNYSRTDGGSTSRGSGGGGETRNDGTSWTTNESRSNAQIKTPLLTPHKLMGLGPGLMTVTLDGLANIIPAYAPPYYKTLRTWLYARDNPYYPGSRR